MKKVIVLFLLLICLLFISSSVQAATTASGKWGNLSWEIKNKTLTIRGTGQMKSLTNGTETEAWMPYSDGAFTSIVIENGITSISDFAFAWCSFVSEVTIPNSVQSIGIYAFSGCNQLSDITLPEGLNKISDNAFMGCAFTTINIPSTVNEIEAESFSQCPNLTSITVSSGNTKYQSNDGVLYTKGSKILCHYPAAKKDKTYSINSNTQTIYGYAFAYCDNLTEINIPDSIVHIGHNAFYFCAGLKHFKLSASMSSIENGTFWWCENLNSVTLPSSITEIKTGAFEGCSKLSDVYYVGSKSQKEKIIMGKYNNKLQNATWHFTIPESISTLILPTGLTEIKPEAFMGAACGAVIIPYGCTAIGEKAFANCKNLICVIIPSSVKDYPENAFEGCNKNLVINWNK